MSPAHNFQPHPSQEKEPTRMSPAKNTAAAAPAETELSISPTNLRVVQEGEHQPTTEELVEHFAALVVENERAGAELRAEAAKFSAVAESNKAELRKLLTPGKHPVGNLTVSITEPSRSFDSAAFIKAYPVEVNPALYKSVINTEAVPPNLKNQFMAAGTGEREVAVK